MNSAAPPKISIIITSRNNEETIGACLQSLVELDYPKDALEIILVDAVSNDNTQQIAGKSF